ncbi:MAG: V-type ATP synthase subunit D [Planctomycetota bacterium]|jgi:V/A-type H+-transporting ATPase subunit D
MQTLSATRTELLARRHRIELARQGRALLQDKRDQLLAEFRKLAHEVLAGGDALESAAAAGRRALTEAEVVDGPAALHSAALARTGTIRLSATTRAVMGIRFPEIEHGPLTRARTERGYSLAGSSAHIDAVAERFEATLELLLEVATEELRLRRLADEIGAATRRVNALEYVLIPRLQRECARIEATLEERERQEKFRLKRVMKRRRR